MKKLFFVPEDFKAPTLLESESFRLRPLQATDVDLDYEAVMSSIDRLKGVLGDDWPNKDMTKEENLKSLQGHEKEFKNRVGFTYTVMNLEENECLGCVYIYPSRLDDYDAEIIMWVTQKAYNKGMDSVLFEKVDQWIKKEWPFKKIIYPGRKIAWGTFFEILEKQDQRCEC